MNYCPKTPQNGPSWVLNPQKLWYLPSKSENGIYRETRKLVMDKLWKNAGTKGYVIISVQCLPWCQATICLPPPSHLPFSLSHFFLFWINFTRILGFIWDLLFMLFDKPENLISGEILVFTNILGFPGVYKLTPKIYL